MMTTAIMACKLSPCANNGNCTSMGAFDCNLSVGSTSMIDSATCPSNGKCVDGVSLVATIELYFAYTV